MRLRNTITTPTDSEYYGLQDLITLNQCFGRYLFRLTMVDRVDREKAHPIISAVEQNVDRTLSAAMMGIRGYSVGQ